MGHSSFRTAGVKPIADSVKLELAGLFKRPLSSPLIRSSLQSCNTALISRPTLSFNKSAPNAQGLSDDFKREILFLLSRFVFDFFRFSGSLYLRPFRWNIERHDG